MHRFEKTTLFAQDFKCFGAEPQGFDEVRRLNLIIGRNNTGKSALLDLVRYAASPFQLDPYAYRHRVQPSIRLTRPLDEATIRRHFSESRGGGRIPGANHLVYGMTLVGSTMSVELLGDGTRGESFALSSEYVPGAQEYLTSIARGLDNPFASMEFSRIGAERDIAPEADREALDLGADGAGATNIVQRVINDEGLPSELVEEVLRGDLNRIMGPDAEFTRIAAQRTADDKWMVYLDERAKGRISLSDSGSGLKTILLVLINMLVMPALKGRQPANYLFAFEELENNLHPGLQRRLLRYVQEKLVEFGAVGFITTHAPAVIDMFSKSKDCQVLHVTHDGLAARVRRIATSADGHGLLNDLDVRASDLLQANGIVWVEGISDVVYLRRWIELYCQAHRLATPVEGSEFAFMEYGGKCLSHLDLLAASVFDVLDGDLEWLLPALAVSRNTFVVMDSDKAGGNSNIRDAKLKAAQDAGGSWITAGREIENYLAPEVSEAVFGARLGKYDSAAAVHKNEKMSRLDKKKAALTACELMSAENWVHRDLEERVGELVAAIASWNPTYTAEGPA